MLTTLIFAYLAYLSQAFHQQSSASTALRAGARFAALGNPVHQPNEFNNFDPSNPVLNR